MDKKPSLEDREHGQVWNISTLPFMIGRDQGNDLVFASVSISREHVQIRQQAKGYVIEDLDSRNGTFVNGMRLGKETRKLISGDLIVLGGYVSLVFIDPNETSFSPPVGRLRGVWIDEVQCEVWVDHQKIEPPLTVQQYNLLALMYRAGGKMVTRDEIVREVWSGQDPAGISQDAIDTVIKRLRSRLRASVDTRDYIEIVRGQGLRLFFPE